MAKIKQKVKTKFRGSSTWKDFRKKMKEVYSGKDALTGFPLRKGWNLHHMDLDPENYTDISNLDNFIPLNKASHEVIHFCFRYYQKDQNFLTNLEKLLKRMLEVNS